MGQGFVKALTLINLLAMAGGVTLGIIIGCLPGLSAAMGVALMLPLTFTMRADTGLIVLGAIYCGAIFGGSISAILIHTPGTPASAATAIEGYQMTLQGRAGKALATACWSSFWGGLLSCISLYFFSPLLAQLALKFMSAEKFWLGIFGLTIIAGVSSKSIVKGLMSGALGLLISTIGLDPIDGTKRFMFGQAFLAEGINTTCALIGLFSMSQVFILAEKKIKERAKATKFSDKIRLTRGEKKMLAPTVVRSWIIGNIIGILPGAGASIACFMGYNNARQFSKHKEEFGHGAIEGVCGSEAANNAVTGGSLIPMLTLGIPGESVTAVLMGGLIIQGLTPGPELFTKHAAMTYTFFAGFVLVQFFMLAIGTLGCRGFAQISRLSGGEKRRLYLLKVLMEAPNFLILDEPTNDLDIRTLEILEDYLQQFPGIVVSVSHDRYFLDKTAGRLFAFEGDGRVTQFEGSYSEYLEQHPLTEEEGAAGDGPAGNGRQEKAPRAPRTRTRRLKFTYREEKEYAGIESEIAALEERAAELDREMTACASDFTRLQELMAEKEAVSQAQLEKMERFFYLSDLAERIAAGETVTEEIGE